MIYTLNLPEIRICAPTLDDAKRQKDTYVKHVADKTNLKEIRQNPFDWLPDYFYCQMHEQLDKAIEFYSSLDESDNYSDCTGSHETMHELWDTHIEKYKYLPAHGFFNEIRYDQMIEFIEGQKHNT